MNANTMYVRRKRIKKRIGLEKDIDLEEWLQNRMVEKPADE